MISSVLAALKIDGWMEPEELRWLASTAASLPPGSVAIEVGSWKGRSTKAIAGALSPGSVLYAVDHWKGSAGERLGTQREALNLGADVMFETFSRNLSQEISFGRVVPVRADSAEGAQVLSKRLPGRAQWVFLDGDHEYEPTKRDIILYRALLAPGGILSGHDYWQDHPGVRRAVDEAVPGFAIGARSIWWRKWACGSST